MKEMIVNGTAIYTKNKFETFYTKLIGKKITLFWVWCLVLVYGILSMVFAAIYQNAFWVISCMVSMLVVIFGFFAPLNKTIFTFKPLPYFFGSKRKYENHVKNVLSAVKKNTKINEPVVHQYVKDRGAYGHSDC